MLLEKWGVGFFYDAGNSLTPSSALTLEQGTGAGIRWLSPIGLVRVDGAYAIGSRNLVRLHIGIGPDL
jgi:translocation and assembly module TamA